jgi:uncharacterized coiled-coil DUF342 family protein
MERKKGGDDGTPTEQLLEQLGKTIEGLQQDKEHIAKEAWELKEAYDTLRAERDELAVLCKQQDGQIKHMHGRQRTMLGWIRDYKAERDELLRFVDQVATIENSPGYCDIPDWLQDKAKELLAKEAKT